MTTPSPSYTGVQPVLDPAQIIAGNSRLHDNWQLRYAVVVDVLSDTQATGRYDGDIATTIPLISLIGTPVIGQRVAIIYVPPGGNYIISSLDPTTQTKIGETLLTVSQPSIVFAVSPDWRSIDVVWTARDDAAAGIAANYIYVQVNGDVSANYRYNLVQLNNATVVGASVVAATQGNVGISARGTSTATVFGGGKITFTGWNTPHTNHLTWVAQSGIIDSTIATSWSNSTTGVYRGNGPYGSLLFFPEPGTPNFVAGTQFTLYGTP